MTREDHHFRWHYGELDDKNFQLHGRSLLLLIIILLSALLLFIFIFVYFRRKCRFRANPVAAGGNGGRGGGDGMEEAAVRRLPMRVREEEAAACSICLSMVMEGEKERVLPGCDHGFHPDCVDEWLRKQSSCPLCRTKVSGHEEKVEIPPEEAVAAVEV